MIDQAKIFVDFEYGALMDVAKQLLTVEIAILVISVALSENVLKKTSSLYRKVAVIFAWILFGISVTFGILCMTDLWKAGVSVRMGNPDWIFVRSAAIGHLSGSLFIFLGGLAYLVALRIWNLFSSTV